MANEMTSRILVVIGNYRQASLPVFSVGLGLPKKEEG
jgi:hypothetical protein